MPTTIRPKDIDQLLAEADELMGQIDSGFIQDMQEEQRIQYEMHAQNLKKLRPDVQGKSAEEEAPESGSYSDGMHKAIRDIVTAMKNMAGNLGSSKNGLDKT
jgi:hypothetical protein